MVSKFNEYTAAQELIENTLFTTPAERDDLVKSKDRVAGAFLLNFFGMLGLINATSPTQKRQLIQHFKTDAKLRIDTIDDSNHDISLSLKLANDAGFFINSTTVAEITRFFVKLKLGQVDHIDSTIAAKWANDLKPEFITHIVDPQLRSAFVAFRNDEGKTIDVSRLAIQMKNRVNKAADGGHFKLFAKKFLNLTEVPPSATAGTPAVAPQTTVSTPDPAATPASTPAAPAKLNYYQRQKLKKAQAAASGTPLPTPAPSTQTPHALRGLNYYQRQKLKAAAAAAGVSIHDYPDHLAKQAADAAAAEEERKKAAEAAAKAKAEEDERKAKEAAARGIPAEMWKYLFDNMVDPYNLANYQIARQYTGDKDLMPDVVKKFIDLGAELASVFSSIMYHGIAGAAVWPGKLNVVAADLEFLRSGKLDSKPMLLDIAKSFAENAGHTRFVAVSKIILSMWVNGDFTDAEIEQYFLDAKAILSPTMTIEIISSGALDERQKKLILDLLAKHMSKAMIISHAVDSELNRWKPEINWSMKTVEWKPDRDLRYTAWLFDEVGITGKELAEAVARSTDWSPARESFLLILLTATSVNFAYPDVLEPLNKTMEQFFKTELVGLIESDAAVARAVFAPRIASRVYDDLLRYDPTLPRNGGVLFTVLHDAFAKQIEDNGWVGSVFEKITSSVNPSSFHSHIARLLGIDLKKVLAGNPTDFRSIDLAMRDHIDNLTDEQLQIVLRTDADRPSQKMSVNNIAFGLSLLLSRAGGDPQIVRDRTIKALTAMYRNPPADMPMRDSLYLAKSVMDQLPHLSSDVMIDFIRAAMEKKDTQIMTHSLYSNLHRSDKNNYITTLQAIMQDAIGTDVEDYINDIMEELPQHVLTKMRGTLVGASVLADDIQKGEIKPFAVIDSNRMKQILAYNDLNLATLIPNLGKKKKGEKFTEYFKRAKAVAHQAALDDLKVSPGPSSAELKAINKGLLAHHAGRHGDTYPHVNKIFNVNMIDPKFDEFAKAKPQDGNIVPAYHGTGGIAAAMILRYGFKVISASDSSVAGRMLGNGIYFSNKIDKSMQYVSNGGFGRQYHQQGYILSLDVNLGTRNVDYKVAGTGNDSIRSPEWCVFDPKAQIRIKQAYEVTLVPRHELDRILKEQVSNGRMSFKSYLVEEASTPKFMTTSFVFRDGMIPIPQGDIIEYVDFEEALEKGLISSEIFDTSAQGPVIVFDNTVSQEVYDMRSARQLIGDDLKMYVRLFERAMPLTPSED